MLTHEEWVNGAWYKSLLGAPPPANPVRNTKRPNGWEESAIRARGISVFFGGKVASDIVVYSAMDHATKLYEAKIRGAAIPAPDDVRALYERAFAEFGPRALWSSRPSANPTIANLLAITESLRVEGGIAGRRLAVAIEAGCRAAL